MNSYPASKKKYSLKRHIHDVLHYGEPQLFEKDVHFKIREQFGQLAAPGGRRAPVAYLPFRKAFGKFQRADPRWRYIPDVHWRNSEVHDGANRA
jgi:hypothetical protein